MITTITFFNSLTTFGTRFRLHLIGQILAKALFIIRKINLRARSAPMVRAPAVKAKSEVTDGAIQVAVEGVDHGFDIDNNGHRTSGRSAPASVGQLSQVLQSEKLSVANGPLGARVHADVFLRGLDGTVGGWALQVLHVFSVLDGGDDVLAQTSATVAVLAAKVLHSSRFDVFKANGTRRHRNGAVGVQQSLAAVFVLFIFFVWIFSPFHSLFCFFKPPSSVLPMLVFPRRAEGKARLGKGQVHRRWPHPRCSARSGACSQPSAWTPYRCSCQW